jgi:LPXTG-site transpeptidase (sortase) family protein
MSLIPKNNFHDETPKKKDLGYKLHRRRGRTINPVSENLKITTSSHTIPKSGRERASPAVELIRRKLDELYAKEPSVKQEVDESRRYQEQPIIRSKHQQFMYDLSISGKSLAQIQTDWHSYYIHLPDNEKHEVWQEFYETNARHPSAYNQFVGQKRESETPSHQRYELPVHDGSRSSVIVDGQRTHTKTGRQRNVSEIKRKILKSVSTGEKSRLKARHHLQSLAFGIGLGSLVILVFLFSFFNQVIIAPLIQPSLHDQNTPIILDTSGVAPSPSPQVIIPKINVQIPVIYNETSTNDADIENSLEDGVLHYPTTSNPGEQGNAAFFGHSSNNILNSGKYKFAFVLLHTLVPGDIFYLTYNDKVYAYQVFAREVVSPNNVSVLDNVPGKVATATLITCDPPGTSINRLVVWGEQISPDPSTDTAPAASASPAQQPAVLANDGPTLWGRLTNWVDHLL